MISKAVQRMRAQYNLKRAIERCGEASPAAAAAYGRAFVAWEGRIRPPATISGAALAHAYTTAQLRAYGQAGVDNRRWRAHERAKAAAFIRSTLERGAFDLRKILTR